MPGVNPDGAEDAGRAALSGPLDIKATDAIEGMLSAQIIAAHEAAMHLRQLAWHPKQSFEVVAKIFELAEKAARLWEHCLSGSISIEDGASRSSLSTSP